MEAWHDGQTFTMGCAGGDTEDTQGLSKMEFVEILARCAQEINTSRGKEAKGMQLAQRFLEILDQLVGGHTAGGTQYITPPGPASWWPHGRRYAVYHPYRPS